MPRKKTTTKKTKTRSRKTPAKKTKSVKKTQLLGKPASIIVHFADLTDPRVDRTKQHSLNDILVIAITAVICGADDWVSVAQFGRDKLDWFRGFLDLPNGIPSHDTFGRVFAALKPDEFNKCFTSWMAAVAEKTNGRVVAIDGKTLRRSFDRASSRSAIHMVSAWASASRVVLGQVKTEEKSNEITAIPALLDLLDVEGCIVTIDAMGCQKAIAKKIVDGGGDYVFGLKGNQAMLHIEVEEYFREALRHDFAGTQHSFFEEECKGHGRREKRRVWTTEDIDWFQNKAPWKGLRSIAVVESTRIVGDKKSVEHRFYITSLPGDDARRVAHAIREHWGIENGLHWVLDVAFREDDCRVRKDNAAENLAIIRHIAVNLLKSERSAKVGIKNKRLKAGWSEAYLLRVLGF